MIEILKKYNFWNNEPIRTGYFRSKYMEQFSKYIDNSLIKVITGQRRVGKSYLFRMLIEWLIINKKVPPKNIFYLNKEIYELDFINTSHMLQLSIYQYLSELKPMEKFIFF